MKKKMYEAPELELLTINVECGFAQSGEPRWFDYGGEGDFTYTTSDDDMWE